MAQRKPPKVDPGYGCYPKAYILLCSLAGIYMTQRQAIRECGDTKKVNEAYEQALKAMPDDRVFIETLYNFLWSSYECPH
jgi:hypothetical protein